MNIINNSNSFINKRKIRLQYNINLYLVGLHPEIINYGIKNNVIFEMVRFCCLKFENFEWINNIPVLTVSGVEDYNGKVYQQCDALFNLLKITDIRNKYNYYKDSLKHKSMKNKKLTDINIVK
jgi:hypothetical protein